jgi:Ca2+-binding EF-hand superfamily protein
MKNRQQAFRAAARTLAGGAAFLLLAACSNSMPDTDRVFLSAAGSWDRDRDGIVTCEEWRTYAAELFAGADGNGDGYVERTEYPSITGTDKMFETVGFTYYDADGDGKLSRTEFVDKPNRAFALLDQSNQCQLSASQVAGARAHTEKVFDTKKPKSGDPRENPTPGIP